MAPMVTFVLALIGWAVIPFGRGMVLADINVGVLYLFAISSLGVYGVIMAGWASNSRYAFLGALRSSAQMVSYEIAIGLIILSVLVTAGSLNLSDIVRAQQTRLVLHPAFPDVHDLHRLDPGRDQPAPVRPAGGRGDAGHRLQRRIQLDGVRALLPRRVRQHDPDERDHLRPVPGRLAGAVQHVPVHADPGPDLVHPQDLLRPVHLLLGPRDPAPLPLRPADAAGLEGVPARLAALARADRRRSWSRSTCCRRPEAEMADARPRGAHAPLAGAGQRLRHDPALHVQEEGDAQLPLREGAAQPALSRRARAATLSQRRGALHRLQAVRGGLPGAVHRDRERAARRRQPAHHPLRHRHDQVHLLRLLRGGLPGRCHRPGAELRVRRRDARGAVLQQGEAAGERRALGAADRAEPRRRLSHTADGWSQR